MLRDYLPEWHPRPKGQESEQGELTLLPFAAIDERHLIDCEFGNIIGSQAGDNRIGIDLRIAHEIGHRGRLPTVVDGRMTQPVDIAGKDINSTLLACRALRLNSGLNRWNSGESLLKRTFDLHGLEDRRGDSSIGVRCAVDLHWKEDGNLKAFVGHTQV